MRGTVYETMQCKRLNSGEIEMRQTRQSQPKCASHLPTFQQCFALHCVYWSSKLQLGVR